jgi:acyl-CoA synthetase (AMP-forming)/AMP-acid ligase II
MDDEGYAYIVDRLKDMINVGGEKVFSSEVEDMMLAHPQIKDGVIIPITPLLHYSILSPILGDLHVLPAHPL